MTIRRILEIDRRFFRDYQRQLLWIANTRLGRWYFRLEKEHYDKPVVRAFPFAMEYANEDGTFTLVTKTSDKYANRLKHTLRHVKAALLALGFGAFSRPENASALQFLFAGVTLSLRPDANPESSTVDGRVTHETGAGSGVDFSVLRGSAGTASSDSGSPHACRIRADTVTDKWRTIDRSIFLFDTAAINNDSTITAATLTLNIAGKTTPTDTDITKRQLRISSSSPASNTSLTSADFSTVGSTTFGALEFADATVGANHTITLNSSGLSHITKQGISKFGARIGADADGTPLTWVLGQAFSYSIRMAENAGTSDDPTLAVTYDAKFLATESVTTIDTVSKQSARAYGESVLLEDTEAHETLKAIALDESQATLDSFTRKKTAASTFDEQSQMVDTAGVGKFSERLFSDTFVATDFFSRLVSFKRAFFESVSIRDFLFFWRPRVKPSTSWTERTSDDTPSIWTDRTPPSTSW